MKSLLCLAALMLAGASAQAVYGPIIPEARITPEPPPNGGPTELIITYRCPPPRRAAFRQYMLDVGLGRFERWKQDGVLKDYKFLFNWYIDVDTWDAMAVLSFPSYAEIARWKDIEHANPGGLSRDALEIAWPLNTYSADLVWQSPAGQVQDHSNNVYYVVPYDAGGDFRDYAESGLVPQAKGWMQAGILSGYQIYRNRYPGGKRWQALTIFEYKDMPAFGRRDEVAAQVRAQLASDPAWKASEARQMTGLEREPVVADPLVAHVNPH